MLHNVVVNLKNSNVLYGYYRTDHDAHELECSPCRSAGQHDH